MGKLTIRDVTGKSITLGAPPPPATPAESERFLENVVGAGVWFGEIGRFASWTERGDIVRQLIVNGGRSRYSPREYELFDILAARIASERLEYNVARTQARAVAAIARGQKLAQLATMSPPPTPEPAPEAPDPDAGRGDVDSSFLALAEPREPAVDPFALLAERSHRDAGDRR